VRWFASSPKRGAKSTLNTLLLLHEAKDFLQMLTKVLIPRHI